MPDIANTQHHCLGLWPVQRTFREIMFLQELTMHDNIIKYALLTPLVPLPLSAASKRIRCKHLLAVCNVFNKLLHRRALHAFTSVLCD